VKVYIVTRSAFPIGFASTNRILSYARGFVFNKIETKILCLRPTEKTDSVINTDQEGIYNGIPYVYTSGTTIKSSNTFVKILQHILGLINAFSRIKKDNSNSKIDAIILYERSLVLSLFFFVVTKLLKITYLKEESEYPFVERKDNLYNRIYLFVFINFSYRLFDGMLIMTKILIEYFKDKVNSRAQIIHIPMTVEFERFENVKKNNKGDYLAYCGDLNPKDGIEILIKSFKIVSEKYPLLKLLIIGDNKNNSIIDSIKSLLHKLKIDDRVILTGRVSRDDMPDLLCNAIALCLSRPSSIQAHGGFPTKLGEYLATGKPVIVTSVGEIPIYLTDGDNALIAEPDNVDHFASKIDIVLSNQDKAKEIGMKGKEVAINNFNYKFQSMMVINFIKKIQSNNLP
jgi:glycosyltransferase involved in cell wall biosynthesis